MHPPDFFPIRLGLFLFALLCAFVWPDATRSHLAQPNQSPTARVVSILTQHNDNDRTGWNPYETQLTPQSINHPNKFGKLFDLPVDGFIYAQPLVVSALDWKGQVRNVLIAATEHNSVYVFDADKGDLLWHRNFGATVPIPNRVWNKHHYYFQDLTAEVGITSTPVIDRATGTIYLAYMTWDKQTEPPSGHHWLRALDLVTGRDKFGSPVRVEGTVPLRGQHALPTMGRHNVADTMDFVPNDHLQRPGLLLSQGRVFLAYGGHGDKEPFQGWVFAYDAKHLQEVKPLVWCSVACGSLTTATRQAGGIWQGAMGLTTDAQGDVYLITGNGTFSEKLECYGDSIVKLSASADGLRVADYFSPCNQAMLEPQDIDLGASGVLHIPGTDFLLGGGKQGRLYLLDRNHMGRFAGNSNDFNCANPNVRQEFQVGCDTGTPATLAPDTPCDPPPSGHFPQSHHIHSSPVFWRSNQHGPVAYVWTENDVLRALPFDERQGKFVSARTDGNGQRQPLTVLGCQSPEENPMEPWATGSDKSPGAINLDTNQMTQLHQGMTGGMLSLSSNQGNNGIVWATTPANNDSNAFTVPGILRAYDADDLRHELWNSFQERTRDDLGNFAKHTPPTVANGKVYVATFSYHLSVYGLHPKLPLLQGINQLQDHSFDKGEQHWKGKFSVNDALPYHGLKQGVLCPKLQEDADTAQVIPAHSSAYYRLTAYCATNILPENNIPSRFRQLTLGVSVNGRVVARQSKILPYVGYQPYSLRFYAAKGSKVQVWYYAPRVRPISRFHTSKRRQPTLYAVIDNITLALDAQQK